MIVSLITYLRFLHYLRFLFSLRLPRKLFAYHLFVSVSLWIEWYVALAHCRCGATYHSITAYLHSWCLIHFHIFLSVPTTYWNEPMKRRNTTASFCIQNIYMLTIWKNQKKTLRSRMSQQGHAFRCTNGIDKPYWSPRHHVHVLGLRLALVACRPVQRMRKRRLLLWAGLPLPGSHFKFAGVEGG